MRRLKQKGAVFVELVVVLPFLLYMFFCIFYVGLCIHDKVVSEYIVREAARLATYEYGEVLINAQTEEDAYAKVKHAVEERCSSQLYLYTYEENDNLIVHDDDSVTVNLVVKEDDDISVFLLDICPDYLHSSLMMNIENHIPEEKGQ